MSKYIIEKINEQALKDKKQFIEKSEEKYFSQLHIIIKDAIKHNVKFIFVAGPSSSGKTTTAKYLCSIINEQQKNANYISLDDFFLNRTDTPLLPNGEKDYENIKALDIAEMQKCFNTLIEKGIAHFPHYDFFTGINTKEVREVTLGENSIIVVEGNHAFNPVVTSCVDGAKFIRVFVHPEHQFANRDGKTIVDPFQLRLIRRTIRDVGNRGYKPEHTLKMWNSVREGEDKYIFPYIRLADYVINTTYAYEVMVYRTILDKLLAGTKNVECESMLSVVQNFVEINMNEIPEKSLMWEFLANLKI